MPAGTTLTPRSGLITVTTPGTTIKDLALNGQILVEASNTTIEDSNITVNGSQSGCSSPCGGFAIRILEGATGTVIRHIACHGGAATGEDVTNFCLKNEGGSSTRVSYLDGYNTAACFWGGGVYEDNYCIDNGEIPQAHYEDIYDGGGEGSLVLNHNTLLNPNAQTATIFLSIDFGDQPTIAITNNLLAGGGYVIYGGAKGAGGSLIGPVSVTGNRFTRLYYPNDGYYGTDAYFNEAITTWSGNYWDETLQAVPFG